MKISKLGLEASGLIALLFLAMIIVPIIIIEGINKLAQAGGSTLDIPITPETWVITCMLMLIFGR